MAGELDIFSMASMAWQGFGIFFIIGIVGVIVLVFFKMWKDKKDYNKKAVLIRHYGNTRVPISDLFKFVFDRKNNVKYFYGKKSKAKIPADTFESIAKEEGNKDFMLIDNPAPDEYVSMKITDSGAEPLISTNKKAWYVYAHRDNISRFDFLDFLSKYANVIALVGIVILMLISFIFQGALMDKVNNGIALQNSYASSIEASTENQAKTNELLYQIIDKAINLTQIIKNTENLNNTGVIVQR